MRHESAYLLDILLAAREAVSFLAESTWPEFLEDRKCQLAVTKSLEIIGEAAGRISTETRDAHPEIPWRAIIGMRNRLTHDYFEINFRRVWDVVHEDLPALITAIEPLVPPEE